MEQEDKGQKYVKTIKSRSQRDTEGKLLTVDIDIYSILEAYPVSAPLAHAVKKILCAGLRGHKNRNTDLREAIVSIERELDFE